MKFAFDVCPRVISERKVKSLKEKEELRTDSVHILIVIVSLMFVKVLETKKALV